jgi:hypothetical protein
MSAPTQNPSAILSSLRSTITELAVARQEMAARSAELKGKRAAFEATLDDDVAGHRQSVEYVGALEADVRVLAEAAYHVSGAKKPAAGVEIKLLSTFAITDADAALAWAKRTELCLIPEALDSLAVMALAKAGQVLPFVTAGVVPRVSIATDLVKALGPDFSLDTFDALVAPLADDPFADLPTPAAA